MDQETEWDLLEVVAEKRPLMTPVHEHSYVALIDLMPRILPKGRFADMAVASDARQSTGGAVKTVEDDRKLIWSLMGEFPPHTSPFEMVQLKYELQIPIFVARQLVRHRTMSLNEFSARYSEMPDMFYMPEPAYVCAQSKLNHQGSAEPVDEETYALAVAYLQASEAQYVAYKNLLDRGVARETARMGLPLTIYTRWRMSINLHNFLHLAWLRTDGHAQRETRDIADPMLAYAELVAPDTVAAWKNFKRDTVVLAADEVEAFRHGTPLASENARRRARYQQKLDRLGVCNASTT